MSRQTRDERTRCGSGGEACGCWGFGGLVGSRQTRVKRKRLGDSGTCCVHRGARKDRTLLARDSEPNGAASDELKAPGRVDQEVPLAVSIWVYPLLTMFENVRAVGEKELAARCQWIEDLLRHLDQNACDALESLRVVAQRHRAQLVANRDT